MNVNAVLELQEVNGLNKKQDVIRKYASDNWFRTFLYYALNPLLSYKLSEETLLNNDDVSYLSNTNLVSFSDIFECCEYLSRLRGIDEATIRQVKVLLYNHCGELERNIYIKLLAKTLRLGITAKTINKVIPGLVPEWEVQQAFPIEKYPIKNGTQFWLTEKLNGVRATFYNGQLIARSGAEFHGLEHIVKEISWIYRAGFVLDGELTLKDELRKAKPDLSDNEAFRITTGVLNSDKVNKTGICYRIFDIIPIKDFESLNPTTTYANRRIILDELDSKIKDKQSVKVLPVLYNGTDTTQINTLLDKMVAEDKEGLVANLDVPYQRTRHRGILKVKRFYTMDLPIVRCEEGSGRLEGTLGAFVLKYKDNEVKVGSGFTDEQRQAYWQVQDSLIGVLCEVKYKEVSSDKNTGRESLQFPLFIQLRKDKTEVSYG